MFNLEILSHVFFGFPNIYTISLESGKSYDAKAIIIAAGSNPRKLNVPGEKEHENKGVAFCSICDGPVFKNKEVGIGQESKRL